MNTTAAVVIAGGVVVLGQWATGKEKVPLRVLVGVAGVAIALAIMDEANPALASAFGMLIVAAAVLTYAQPIAKWLGY